MIIITREQRTPEWYAARRGLPTASEFGSIITPKKMEYAAAADTYIDNLIDELMRPEAHSEESWTGNRHTRRGELLEPEAAGTYAFDRDVRLTAVGLVLSDCRRFGCSPDALIGEDGMLEAKAPDGPTIVRWIREHRRTGDVPLEHKAQVHGSLIVTGRKWVDFLAYCRGYDPLVIRVTPDKFTDRLREHLDRFHTEYVAALAAFGLTHPGESLEAAA
ncbi:lambda exonuclease family protein [Tabrizicola sp.]|uniref:lambda exonuclease family protein n=1 Tax=Tabrizicola sp. TaxID=2005166 RepID=UPI003F40BDF9